MKERPAFAGVVAAVEQVKERQWAEFRDEYGDTGRDMALYLGRRLSGMKLAELAKAIELRYYGVVATNAKRYERRLAQDRAEISPRTGRRLRSRSPSFVEFHKHAGRPIRVSMPGWMFCH